MKVRYPEFDFEHVAVHWDDNHEAAQVFNAFNVVPTYIEPFLIKVMRRAKAELDPDRDAELLADITIFNRQEGQHTKVHAALLQQVRENGYQEIERLEKDYADDYDRWLNEKSLRFLLAYSEGFEAFGSAISAAWVDGTIEDLLDGAGSTPLELWKWHLAEEYEHRTVVYRVYERLYGRPRTSSYLYRVAMYAFALSHLMRHMLRVSSALLEHDRRNMSPAERRRSIARELRVHLGSARAYLRGLVRPLSPFYDPARVPPPRGLHEVLDRYDIPRTG